MKVQLWNGLSPGWFITFKFIILFFLLRAVTLTEANENLKETAETSMQS